MKAWRDKEEFKARVLEWAGKLDVSVNALAVRPMRNKWASCSTNGNLNFNTELLGMNKKVGDYVIVHELLHFSVPNHGKLWKSLMRAHLGDFESAEDKLRRFARPFPRKSVEIPCAGFGRSRPTASPTATAPPRSCARASRVDRR